MIKIKFPKWWYESGINRISHPIIDHCVCKKREDGLIQVYSRPYSFSMDLLWKLMIQCKAYGIDFRIDGKSDYSNKDTLSIVFWKVLEEKQINESQEFQEIIKHNEVI